MATTWVEEGLEWNGISENKRKLWFGVATKGMTAPWLGAFGACFVKIWDIRQREDGTVEYGVGNETEPPKEELVWITGDKFYDEWPD